jgi:hypothetical protein
MECRLAGETEVLGENLRQRHFVHHNLHDVTYVSTIGHGLLGLSVTSYLMK